MRDILSRDLEIATNTTMPPAKATVNGHKQTLIKSLETLSTKAHIEGGVASIHRTAEKVHSRKSVFIRSLEFTGYPSCLFSTTSFRHC